MVYSLDQVNQDHINVRAPRRYDGTCVCKIKYNGGKLDVLFPNVKVLNIKHHDIGNMYVQFKLDKPVLKNLVRMEKAFIECAIQNTVSWFGQRMKPSIVEDYFTSNITIDDSHGATFKARLQEPFDGEIEKDKFYNLQMRVSSIIFYKQSFNIGWNIVKSERVEINDFVFDGIESDLSDSDESIVEEESPDLSVDEDPEPDHEELDLMVSELSKRAKDAINNLSLEIESLTIKRDNLVSANVKMIESPLLKTISDLHELLDEVSSYNEKKH